MSQPTDNTIKSTPAPAQLTLGDVFSAHEALIAQEKEVEIAVNNKEFAGAEREESKSPDSQQSNGAALAPMLRHYLELKGEHGEKLLLYQVGDFYELFFDDARRASEILGIRLTSRNKDNPDPVPMCGVPVHAIENYLPRILAAGCSCVVVSQLEEEGGPKKNVRREISRIVTPGVRYEGDGLDEKQFNFLAAACINARASGALCYADVSTGDLHVAEVESPEELAEMLDAVRPAELILPSTLFSAPVERARSMPKSLRRSMSSLRGEPVLRPFEAVELKTILRRLGESRVNQSELELLLSCDPSRELCAVLSVLLDYVAEISFGKAPTFSRFSLHRGRKTVFVDSATRRNLELTEARIDGDRRYSLLAQIDKCRTAMGSRLLLSWILAPSAELAEIRARHDSIDALLADRQALSEIRGALTAVRDLDRLATRITAGRANPRDLASLRDSLAVLPDLARNLQSCRAGSLAATAETFDPLADVQHRLALALIEEPPLKSNEGGIFLESFHPEIERLRRIRSEGRSWISSLEERERQRTGITTLKVRYNNVFGYFIEVSKANLARVPSDYERRQTLVNAERFITPELKHFELEVLSAKSRQIELERELFLELRSWLASQAARIQETAAALAVIDVLAGLSQLALENNYCRPTLSEGGAISISDGRHPIVEQVIGSHNFIPNDTRLDDSGRRFAILTGPNMGGKSTYLRQVGLIQILAQAGSFVPARAAALPLVDRIFTRIGAADDLARGDSTFMVEMREASIIIRRATGRSLVLIDEIGRGTATADGLAIATAIAEWLFSRARCMTIFATHFHELTRLAGEEGVFCLAVGILENETEPVFTHRIEERAADRSYGIEVARLAGLPEPLIRRAKQVMADSAKLSANPGEGAANLPEASSAKFTDEFEQKLLELKERIERYDLNSMTPIEALFELSKLKSLAAKPE